MPKLEKRIILCLAHMSGNEQKYIKEAFDTNWVVPLGPNVYRFEEDLKRFVTYTVFSKSEGKSQSNEMLTRSNSSVRDFSEEDYPQSIAPHENDPEKLWLKGDERLKDKQVVALASGTSAVHLALVALGVKAGDEVICQSFTFCASSHPALTPKATRDR